MGGGGGGGSGEEDALETDQRKEGGLYQQADIPTA